MRPNQSVPGGGIANTEIMCRTSYNDMLAGTVSVVCPVYTRLLEFTSG